MPCGRRAYLHERDEQVLEGSILQPTLTSLGERRSEGASNNNIIWVLLGECLDTSGLEVTKYTLKTFCGHFDGWNIKCELNKSDEARKNLKMWRKSGDVGC